MPKICLEVPDLTEAMARPIVMQVVRQMVDRIGISLDTPVRFKGSQSAVSVTGSTLDNVDELNRLPPGQRIVIEVTEDYTEDHTLTTAVKRPETLAIFRDAKLGVYLKPVYQKWQVQVNVTLVAPDKTSADTWVMTMRRRATQGVAENLHLVDYHYPLPIPFVVILTELHRLRENKAGYGEDLAAWLRRCLTDRFTSIADQAGNNALLAIRETQQAILGWYDFTATPPKPEKDSDSGSFSVAFTYTFNYDRPESVVMQYPLMVHNQLLDDRFYPNVKPPELEDVVTAPSLSTAILRNFTYEARNSYAWRAYPGIPVPYFDDWLPEYELPNVQNLMRIMLERDDNNPRAILSLDQLGYCSFPENALAYMRDNPLGLTTYGESIFHVSLYKGQSLVNSNQLMIGADLGIHVVDELDPRSNYHLTITLLKDIGALSQRALQKLSQHGELALTYTLLLDPNLLDTRNVSKLNDRTTHVIKTILNGNLTVPQAPAGTAYIDPVTGLETTTNPNLTPTPGVDRVENFETPLAFSPEPIQVDGIKTVQFTTAITGVRPYNPNFSITIPNLRPNGSISIKELKDISKVISTGKYYKNANLTYFWKLVGAFTIQPHRS